MIGKQEFDWTQTRAYKKAHEEFTNSGNAEESPNGFVGSVSSSPQESLEKATWPEPEPLPGGLLPVPEMHEKLCPNTTAEGREGSDRLLERLISFFGGKRSPGGVIAGGDRGPGGPLHISWLHPEDRAIPPSPLHPHRT